MSRTRSLWFEGLLDAASGRSASRYDYRPGRAFPADWRGEYLAGYRFGRASLPTTEV